jgi:uncharacterized protein YggT (Ycf19 family)
MEGNTTKPLFRGTQIIWYLLTIVEVLLLLRFVLKLLAANPNAGFTNFIYSLSSIFVAPFQAVFRNAAVQGNVFEWTTLLAMIVYYVIALGIIKLLVMGKPVSTTEADSKLSAQDTTGQF